MLDTDICSSIMKRSHPLVIKRRQSVPVSEALHVGRHEGGTILWADLKKRGTMPRD
jgi:hypothetical protein